MKEYTQERNHTVANNVTKVLTEKKDMQKHASVQSGENPQFAHNVIKNTQRRAIQLHTT